MQRHYKIELTETPIWGTFGLAVHRFWVLRDHNGKVLREAHFRPTGPDGKPRNVGVDGDPLKFYEYKYDKENKNQNQDPDQRSQFDPTQPRIVYFQGNPLEAFRVWQQGIDSGSKIGSRSLPYQPFSLLGLDPINSNAGAYSFGLAMGYNPRPLPYSGDMSGRVAPGWDRDLRGEQPPPPPDPWAENPAEDTP